MIEVEDVAHAAFRAPDLDRKRPHGETPRSRRLHGRSSRGSNPSRPNAPFRLGRLQQRSRQITPAPIQAGSRIAPLPELLAVQWVPSPPYAVCQDQIIKLATFSAGLAPELGLAISDRIHSLSRSARQVAADMADLIASWPRIDIKVRRIAADRSVDGRPLSGGVGAAVKLRQFLKVGDLVRAEIHRPSAIENLCPAEIAK
ncbi:MAG: hypothetical protein PSX79_03660, partial [bacterium]|nr:hypothetical protein [bacterium]